jgi:hypothetical protein
MKKDGGSLQQITDGSIGLKDLKKTPGYPTEERFSKGPVPVIECTEEIPCDPCCGGCAKCIVICPGLAVFVVDKTFSENEASVAMPYELLPLPEEGEKIQGVDRSGTVVCEGYVHRMFSGKKLSNTNVVTIVIPKEFADEVRHFKRRV